MTTISLNKSDVARIDQYRFRLAKRYGGKPSSRGATARFLILSAIVMQEGNDKARQHRRIRRKVKTLVRRATAR